jgi:hypothetical protein
MIKLKSLICELTPKQKEMKKDYLFKQSKLNSSNVIPPFNEVWKYIKNTDDFISQLEYYLKRYKGVLTDDVHTELGEKSVKKLLKQAKDIGYKICVLKDNKETIEIDNLNDVDKYYSSGVSGLKYKFLIIKNI